MLQKAIIVLAVAMAIAYFTGKGPFKMILIGIDRIDDEYDYVIIGGGSAGSVLASRLSEDSETKVLLLEAGGSYEEEFLFSVPILSGFFWKSVYDWQYYTEPQEHASLALIDKKQFWPRGRVLGGSSVINALQYTRGNRLDYDAWEEAGCSGWSYKDVLPYFLKAEDIHISKYVSSPYHNTGGPMAVSEIDATLLPDLYMKAGQELGYNVTDYNGKDQAGFSKMQLNVRKGARSHTGVEYLGETKERNHLHIALQTFVTKIEIKDKKATGVYYIRKGLKRFVKARKEVLLSAGAINSPQILMLSGIGPKQHLQEVGVPVVADLPVGQNLQDHPLVFMHAETNEELGISQEKAESLWTKMMYGIFGKGILAVTGIESCAFVHVDNTKSKNTPPDIQFNFFSAIADQDVSNMKQSLIDEYMAKEGKTGRGFSTVVILAHPNSRGYVKLNSTDPFDYPLLNPKTLSRPDDVQTFIKGIRIWEKLMQTPTMKALGVDVKRTKLSFCSEHDFRSDAYWECFARHLTVTGHHQSGTCKMGAKSEKTAVVDPELKVRGIKGLRVVDASIFPTLMTGNTNAPTIMVAEKAADMIKGINSVKHLQRNV